METNYFWDAVTGTCLAELDENGDVTIQYTTNPQTGELISENHAGEEVYHHYDGDGNTRQTADSAGDVLGEATYNAFGETVAEGGDMKTAYRFRGQQGFATDPRTGDVSFASRNYSPNLGRWLSSSEFGAAGAYFPTLFARDEQRRLPEESLGGCNAAEALCIRKAVDLINSRLANSPLWPLGKKLPDGATKSQVCESKLRECVIETLRYIQFSCKDSGAVRDGNLLEYCGADKKRGGRNGAIAIGSCVRAKIRGIQLCRQRQFECGTIEVQGDRVEANPTCDACQPSDLRDSAIVLCRGGALPNPPMEGDRWCDKNIKALAKTILHEALHHCLGAHLSKGARTDSCFRPDVNMIIRRPLL